MKNTARYSPVEYWSWRSGYPGDMTETNGLHRALADVLYWYARSSDTMLEVGPGNGRVFAYLRERGLTDPQRYAACDIAPGYVEACRQNHDIDATLWDGATLPYSDGAFDWVLSFSVLLHVPPVDIERHIAELLRVARRYVFVSTYTGTDGGLTYYCFSHDYARLFADAGAVVARRQEFKREMQTQWLLKPGRVQ